MSDTETFAAPRLGGPTRSPQGLATLAIGCCRSAAMKRPVCPGPPVRRPRVPLCGASSRIVRSACGQRQGRRRRIPRGTSPRGKRAGREADGCRPCGPAGPEHAAGLLAFFVRSQIQFPHKIRERVDKNLPLYSPASNAERSQLSVQDRRLAKSIREFLRREAGLSGGGRQVEFLFKMSDEGCNGL